MSKIDELKRIKTLLDDGLITQAEFDKLKGQILGVIESKQPESNVSEHRETTFTTSDTTNETSIATTPIEQVDDEPSNGRGLKIALAYFAAIAIIGGIIFWAYNKKTSHTESVSQQEIKDNTKTNIILREQNEKESNKSLSDLDDSSEGEHNTNAQSQDLNQNGNSQVEQLPIDNSKIETNSNQNGLKQLLLNYYQSIENNSFDANNYFDEKAAFYWEENLTPSKINKFYDLQVLIKTGSWQLFSNFKVNIVNNQIDLKSMQKDVCLYTYTINESRYDNQYKYTILDKVLIEVGYNVYKQKLVSYKTLKVIETKFQINGKIYSSPTKYITAKVISVDELKDNYFSLTFDLMAEKISFNFPPNEMPVVGDKYSIQVGVDESVPYKSHSGLRALQPYHKRQ